MSCYCIVAAKWGSTIGPLTCWTKTRLPHDKLHEFLVLLLGETAMQHAPDMYVDWENYLNVVQQAVLKEGLPFAPARGRKRRGSISSA